MEPETVPFNLIYFRQVSLRNAGDHAPSSIYVANVTGEA